MSRSGRLRPLTLLCAYLAVIGLLWTLLPATLQSVAHADNIEQYTWAQHLDWGYVKHPPLPTWIFALAQSLAGPSASLSYALGMACVSAALAFTYAAARLLLPPPTALGATLLVSANYYLMGRGSFFNHNTVMLPFVAAAVWASLRICHDRTADRASPLAVWLALGVALALGSLAKYQMAVIGIACATALVALGVWRQAGNRAPLLAAALVAFGLVAPHLWWLWQHHFPSFTYAGHSLLADETSLRRLHTTLGFVVQQIGRLAPALVLATLCGLIPLPEDQTAPRATPAPMRRALAILAFLPPAVVLMMGAAAGVALQNHWGATTFLMLPLWIAVRLADAGRLQRRWLLTAALVLQCAAAVWFVRTAARSEEFHFDFPVDEIATQATAYWEQHCGAEPAIIAGPDWEAGALSLAMPAHPLVLPSGDRRVAPQLTDADIARRGVLVLWRPGEVAPSVAAGAAARPITAASWLRAVGSHGHLWTLGIGAIDPVGGCPAR